MPKLLSELQPHQERAVQKFLRPNQPGLILAHGTGSGKSLSSIAAQARAGIPADIVVPASLRDNYAKELAKHVSGNPDVRIHSLQGLARGKTKLTKPMLIMDEAHWSRNPGSLAAQALRTSPATKRMLLTASPIYNTPADLAPLVNLASGHRVLPESGSEFRKRYVRETPVSPGFFGRLQGIKPGVRKDIDPGKREELTSALHKWVDYQPALSRDYPEKSEEIVRVPMSVRQQEIHDAALGRAPAWVRWKVRHGLPPDKQEAGLLNSFMATSRQVSNSTAGFHREGQPEHPKIQAAHNRLMQHLKTTPKGKAVVYSSFLRSGVEPYQKKLDESGVPHGEFSGRIPKKVRDQNVRDFNAGKKKVLFITRAGAEGLDLKGTRLIQVMEPHWNEENIKQVVGRGVRYRSHAHLPPQDRHVQVQRFLATRRPSTFLERYGLRKPGMGTDEYVHARSQDKESVNRQFRNIMETQFRQDDQNQEQQKPAR